MRRVSLKAIAARIDRLESRRTSTQLDSNARMSHISDLELDWYVVHFIEKAIGAIESYPSSEAVILAMREHPEVGDSRMWVSAGVDHWERFHWFEQHEAHGRIELVWKDPASWSEGVPWGRRWVFECSCAGKMPWVTGVRLCTYEQFVPETMRNLPSREEAVGA